MNTPIKRIENKVQGVLDALAKLDKTMSANSAALTDEDKDKIGKALMLRRQALHRSQKAVAKLAGTTASAVSHIERGLRQPSADLLTRLAGAVDCSAYDQLAGTVSAPRENLHVTRVLNAMKTLPPSQQEHVADYCEFLLKKAERHPRP